MAGKKRSKQNQGLAALAPSPTLAQSTAARAPASAPGVFPKVDVDALTLRRQESTEQAIRDRAYFIFLARGGNGGSPEGDWAEAERQIRAESAHRL